MQTVEQETLDRLLKAYGPLIKGAQLAKELGFNSYSSFYRARQANSLPVTVFELPGRRGPFARTQDIAYWQALLGQEFRKKTEEEMK